jgi:hypothetical protein
MCQCSLLCQRRQAADFSHELLDPMDGCFRRDEAALRSDAFHDRMDPVNGVRPLAKGLM